MPVYRITAPDGTKYRVEAPEGATEQDALAKVQAEHGQSSQTDAKSQRDQTSSLGAIGAGLGKGVGTVALNTQKYIGKGLDAVGVSSVGKWLQNDADYGLAKISAESAPYKEDHPILTGGGEIVGEIAATLPVGGILAKGAQSVNAAPSLVNAIRSGGFRTGSPAATTTSGKFANAGIRSAGGAINGAASAGLVSPDEATSGAMIGGALPGVAGVAGRSLQAVGRSVRGKPIAAEVKALAERAGELGIDVPADRLANSKPLNAVASGLNYVPFSGRAGTEAKMQSQLNQALSRTFGQDSDNVTMALRKAQSDLGGKFDDVLKSNTVNFDQQLLSDIATAQQSAAKELGADGLKAINGQIQELVEKGANGAIDGQAAYNIKRTLDRIGRRSTPEAFHARELKKSLMGALDRSLGTQEAAAFAETRKQYGNMLALENLAQNGAEGNVSIARIANMKNINNKDLQELADISAQFLKPREGQHGAAQRAAAGLGVGSFAGLPVLAGTVAAGRATNSLMNSNALKNAILGNPVFSGKTNKLLETLRQNAYLSAPVVGTQ